MKVKNEEIWKEYNDKNKDAYGNATIRYAEKWANLMEKEIESGKKLIDIADKTSNEADTEGITGFMYGCAVGCLSSCWEYGEELRKWHNKQYGVDENQSGVVNPAILTIKIQ